MKAVFLNQDGSISIVHPTGKELTDEQLKIVVEQAVPTGQPYKLVEDSEIPTDRTFRAAWTIDPALLTDGVGA